MSARNEELAMTAQNEELAMSARLAILTVVRDDRPGLLATHRSLREQTLQDFDWIVVDGASTDGTADWLRAHAGEMAWWRSAPDGGLYDAMNVALDAALAATAASHVLFLNAGDTLAGPEVLARLEAAAIAAPEADLLYGHALERLPDGRLVAKRARSHRLAALGMFTHHQAMLYRTAALGALRFDPGYTVAADYAFTLSVLGRGGVVAPIPRFVCIFAAGGRSQRDADQGRREQAAIRHKLLGYGILRNATLSNLQRIAFSVRKHAPWLYEKFRFRRPDTSCLL